MPLMQGQVTNIGTTNTSDGQTATNIAQGKQTELLCAEIHGKWYNANIRGNLYHFSATGMTTPVIAANLASIFALYNPTGSGVVGEVVCTDLAVVLATTVVNNVAWYQQSGFGAGITIPSTITVGTAIPGYLGAGNANKIKGCTALTAVGTPTLLEPIATFGAVTSTAANPIHSEHDGRIVLYPGSALYLATSTTVWTAAGMAAHTCWVEWTLPV